MKSRIQKGIILTLIIVLVIPILTFGNGSIVSAKGRKKHSPTVSANKKTLVEKGDTFTLSLKDIGENVRKITWYSQNDKIAYVKTGNDEKTAVITSVNEGTTHIKCKITYRGGYVRYTNCHITVKASASKITIKDKNEKIVIAIGEKYNFKSELQPKKTLDKTYWLVDKTEYATVDDKGVVTGRKAGVVLLTAVAAKTEAEVAKSTIRDTVVIEIVDPKDINNPQKNDKPQAKLITLERTGENILTATFDKAIQTPGFVLVSNLEWIQGVVDTKNTTKVNYTLSSVSALLIGVQKVSIGYWSAYNVLPEDKSAEVLKEYAVNFTIKNLLPLPAPTSVSQSQTDNNIVYIQFNNKLDEVTAENKANYSISGATIVSAELGNTTSGDRVTLTLQQNTIATTQNYLVTISGVKGYNNNYANMISFQTVITLKENTPPILLSWKYIFPTTITLTFSETIIGTPTFAVIQNNVDITSSSVVSGNTVKIILKNAPTLNESLFLTPIGINTITDVVGNKTVSILNRTITPTIN